jgi:hypothetical protein
MITVLKSRMETLQKKQILSPKNVEYQNKKEIIEKNGS